ncbi:hypothetical protein SOVF_113450 [Spinacia oleracea]|nr:hypothetical protein SOVF_113450 [Spinacia oleracea]
MERDKTKLGHTLVQLGQCYPAISSGTPTLRYAVKFLLKLIYGRRRCLL